MTKIALYITNNFAINSGSTLFFTNLLECFNNINKIVYVFSRHNIKNTYKNLRIIYLKGKKEKEELRQIFNYDKKYKFNKIFIRNDRIIELLPLYRKQKYFREKLLFWFSSGSKNYSKYFNYINRYNLHLTNSNLNLQKLNYFTNLKIFMPMLDDINININNNNDNNNDKIHLVYFGCCKKEYLIEDLIKIYISKNLHKYFLLDCFLTKKINYIGTGLKIYHNLPHCKLIEYLKNNNYDFSFNIRVGNFSMDTDPSSKLLESIQYNIKPIVNRTKINEELLGTDYPYYYSNINNMIEFLMNYKKEDYEFNKNNLNMYLKSTNINIIKNSI